MGRETVGQHHIVCDILIDAALFMLDAALADKAAWPFCDKRVKSVLLSSGISSLCA